MWLLFTLNSGTTQCTTLLLYSRARQLARLYSGYNFEYVYSTRLHKLPTHFYATNSINQQLTYNTLCAYIPSSSSSSSGNANPFSRNANIFYYCSLYILFILFAASCGRNFMTRFINNDDDSPTRKWIIFTMAYPALVYPLHLLCYRHLRPCLRNSLISFTTISHPTSRDVCVNNSKHSPESGRRFMWIIKSR